MIKKNDFMDYTDDEIIEYIECLEKELDARREIENSFIKVIKYDAEKIKSLYDDKQKIEKALDKAVKYIRWECLHPNIKKRIWTEYDWKEWLLNNEVSD